MSNLNRIAERLIAGWRPTELDIDTVIALYVKMGWAHGKPGRGGSHHQFRKPGFDPVTVKEKNKKANIAAVKELAKHLQTEWELA